MRAGWETDYEGEFAGVAGALEHGMQGFGIWRRAQRGCRVRRRHTEGSALPGYPQNYDRPICPLSEPSAMDLYCSLDGSDELYAKFQDVFLEPSAWEKGHLFLVTGERGYGKTSQIQRCAAWLESEARAGRHCRIVPVDLSDSRWDRSDSDDKMRRTLRRILVSLERLNLLDKGVRSSIEAEDDPAERFHELGDFLGWRRDGDGMRIVPAVLLQGHPTPGEVVSYYNAAEKGMIFFAEMFEKDQIAVLTGRWRDLNRMDVLPHKLELDILKPNDFRAFVRGLCGLGDDWPMIPDSFIDIVEEEIIATERGAGMREVINVMLGTLGMARSENAREVSERHLIRYYRPGR